MTIEALLDRLRAAETERLAALHAIQEQAPALFRALRTRHGLTQRQLADILQCDFTFISKVENGHMRPGKPVLERLATWLEEEGK